MYNKKITAVQYPSRSPVSQEGPKNPLKGTSMKPLVFAWNASSGWMLEGGLCEL